MKPREASGETSVVAAAVAEEDAYVVKGGSLFLTEAFIMQILKVNLAPTFTLSLNPTPESMPTLEMASNVVLERVKSKEESACLPTKDKHAAEIIFSGFGLTDSGGRVLQKVLSTTRSVVKLDFSRNSLTDRASTSLLNAAYENKMLESIDFSHNMAGDCFAAELSMCIRARRHIRGVIVAGGKISDSGCITLCGALSHSKTLTKLDLSGHVIMDAGVQEIFEVLKKNRSITSLNLAANRVHDVSLGKFQDVIRLNPVLKSVMLDQNVGIGNKGASLVLEEIVNQGMAKTTQCALESVNFERCTVSPGILSSIIKALYILSNKRHSLKSPPPSKEYLEAQDLALEGKLGDMLSGELPLDQA